LGKSSFLDENGGRADDPRTLYTRARLIECAEALVAEYGINGVSIRQIVKASQSANSNVVAYHFGNKETLLQAVILYRLPAIEVRRSQLLSEKHLQTDGMQVSDLTDVLYRPFFEQRCQLGRRSYAAIVDELSRANLIDIRTSLDAGYPLTGQILSEIRKRMAACSAEQFGRRIFLASALIFAAIRQIDQHMLQSDESEVQFADACRAATSVIEAPLLG
jgi:AcrR family transcriptional regulator